MASVLTFASPASSFVLDAGVNVTRQISQVWLIRVGYSVFLMDHIARAADQLDFSDNDLRGSRICRRRGSSTPQDSAKRPR